MPTQIRFRDGSCIDMASSSVDVVNQLVALNERISKAKPGVRQMLTLVDSDGSNVCLTPGDIMTISPLSDAMLAARTAPKQVAILDDRPLL